jgi:nitrogen-specific signal transduction histidine kinase
VGDADRAGQIIDRIRDQIKKTRPRTDHFDLNEAIDEVIGLARGAIVKNGVSVQTRFTEGLPAVNRDRVQLQQVVLNLILNAVEAMSAVDEGVRELLLSTEQSETYGVLVAVRDSGPGIDPERRERVFDASSAPMEASCGWTRMSLAATYFGTPYPSRKGIREFSSSGRPCYDPSALLAAAKRTHVGGSV